MIGGKSSDRRDQVPDERDVTPDVESSPFVYEVVGDPEIDEAILARAAQGREARAQFEAEQRGEREPSYLDDGPPLPIDDLGPGRGAGASAQEPSGGDTASLPNPGEDLTQESPAPPANPLQGFALSTWGEIERGRFPTPEFAVDDLLLSEGTGILCAHPGDGKSTLSRFLAFSLSTGEPFAGRRILRPGRVLYGALDEYLGLVSEELKRINAGRFEPKVDFLTEQGGDLDGRVVTVMDAVLAANERVLREFGSGYSLIVIDTLFHLFEDDGVESASEYSALKRVMRQTVRKLQRLTGALVLCLHHPPKGGAPDNFLGSTAIRGSVDERAALFTVNKDEQIRRLEVVHRGGVRPSVLGYRMSDDGTKLLANIDVERVGESKAAVLMALASHDSLTARQLREFDGVGRPSTITLSLQDLKRDGWADVVPQHGNTAESWSLTDDGRDAAKYRAEIQGGSPKIVPSNWSC